MAFTDEQQDPLMALRSRLLMFAMLHVAFGVSALLFAELLWSESQRWTIILALLVSLVASFFNYPRSGNYLRYSHLLIASLVGIVILLTVASGGALRSVLVTLPTAAILAAMLLPTRAALTWIIVTLGCVALSVHLRDIQAPIYIDLNPTWQEGAVERVVAALILVAGPIGVWCYRLVARMHERLHRDRLTFETALNQVQIAEQRLEQFVDMASAWFWETDDQHRMSYLSAGFERSTGISMDRALGLTPGQIMTLRYPNNTAVDSAMRPMLERRGFKDQLLSWHQPLTGVLTHYANSGSPIFDSQGIFRGYRGRVINVSERNETLRHARESVHGDFLTGLMSRRGMLEALDRALIQTRANEQSGWWIVIDLDHFHEVNVRLNYAQGDAFLKRFARSLEQLCTRSETLARMDGDEFGLLLQGVGRAEVEDILLQILGISRGLRIEFLGEAATGSASIGVTRFSSATPNVGAILKSAEAACQKAFSEGGARTVHAP